MEDWVLCKYVNKSRFLNAALCRSEPTGQKDSFLKLLYQNWESSLFKVFFWYNLEYSSPNSNPVYSFCPKLALVLFLAEMVF